MGHVFRREVHERQARLCVSHRAPIHRRRQRLWLQRADHWWNRKAQSLSRGQAEEDRRKIFPTEATRAVEKRVRGSWPQWADGNGRSNGGHCCTRGQEALSDPCRAQSKRAVSKAWNFGQDVARTWNWARNRQRGGFGAADSAVRGETWRSARLHRRPGIRTGGCIECCIKYATIQRQKPGCAQTVNTCSRWPQW